MRHYIKGAYAFDLEGNEPSIRCVAAPIRDASSHIIAAIGNAITVPYMSLEKMGELVPLVKRVAREISAELVGRVSPPFLLVRPAQPTLNRVTSWFISIASRDSSALAAAVWWAPAELCIERSRILTRF